MINGKKIKCEEDFAVAARGDDGYTASAVLKLRLGDAAAATTATIDDEGTKGGDDALLVYAPSWTNE